jgi:class 3 adenylate cyclase
VNIPETNYATVRKAQIAYQVLGDGPDLMFIFGYLNHVDYRWEDPDFARFIRRLGSFSRVILFDRRGTGASDPLPDARNSTWEDWMEDISAVRESVGSKRTAILGSSDGGPIAMLYAATFPEPVTSLVLTTTTAKFTQAPDYPLGVPPDQLELLASLIEDSWGKADGVLANLFVPDRAEDQEWVHWYARLQRASMTPRNAGEILRMLLAMDTRSILPLIQAPTLVVGLTESSLVRKENAEYLAAQIPNSRLLLLKGGNLGASWLNEPERYVAAIEEHVLGEQRPIESDRVLATVLFTDIVRSTEQASELGDQRWRDLLDRHDSLSSRTVAHYAGRLIKMTGDGILAVFDGPARAVRCAADLVEELARSGLRIRSGLHAGEVEMRDSDVGGIAVHIAARVLALANPEEVLVSGTVKDLVVGSTLSFKDRGTHVLKGAGEWPLYAFNSV